MPLRDGPDSDTANFSLLGSDPFGFLSKSFVYTAS